HLGGEGSVAVGEEGGVGRSAGVDSVGPAGDLGGAVVDVPGGAARRAAAVVDRARQAIEVIAGGDRRAAVGGVMDGRRVAGWVVGLRDRLLRPARLCVESVVGEVAEALG